jgi:hypothetical protein
MTRAAHHRSDFRTGPEHRFRQRKAYHLNRILGLVTASQRLARSMRCVGRGLYELPAADRLAWLEALDVAIPYAVDETGEVWK